MNVPLARKLKRNLVLLSIIYSLFIFIVDKLSSCMLLCSYLTAVNIVHVTRSEEGIYYAIDIGGTCFRFLKVELGAGSTIINQKIEYQPIKEELTKGTSEVCLIILFLLS
jgi:hypothetical protein